MKRLITGLFVLAVFLSACAPAALGTSAPTAAAAAAANPAAPAGATVFKIVPAESKASYEVSETLFNKNNKINVAIGTTNTISGMINADKSNPGATTLGPITVDLSKLVSDSGQRDRFIQRQFLESSTYPTATFVTKTITGLPATYTEGTDYTFQISGDLTVKTTTQPVTFQVTANLKGDTLTGSATTQVLMSQFGVGPISLLGILQTQDQVKITFNFVARP